MALDPYIDSVVLGPIVLPPPGMSGHAWMDASPSVKVDEKKATGKNGARMTLQGEENADVTIRCQLNGNGSAFLLAAASVIRELKKAMLAGPLQVTHIQAEACDIGSVQITEIPGGLKPSGGKVTFELKGKGWSASSTQTKGCQLFLLIGSTDKSTSGEVTKWETFLTAQGYYAGPIDGAFGSAVDTATRAFQTAKAILVDGIVGPQTFGEAAKLGYVIPAPKTCGSATKTPKKAEENTEPFGPSADEFYAEQAAKNAAKEARAAALAEWEKNGTVPNERGEGLDSDSSYDPYAKAMNEGGAP